VHLEIKGDNCAVYHVLEALEGDLEQYIQERKLSNSPFKEKERVK